MGRRTPLEQRNPSKRMLANRRWREETTHIDAQAPQGTVTSVDTGTNLTGGPITDAGTISISVTKGGATQGAAGAAAGELWYTVSHATLPDNVVMLGV